MVRPITGLDLGLLALNRMDGSEERAPRPAESEAGNLALRRLDPELARLYLPPGRLAGESAPGGTMAARRVELGRGEDLVSLGPTVQLDRMAVIRFERPTFTDADDRVRVLDASELMAQVPEASGPRYLARHASEAYRAFSPQDPSKTRS